MIFDHECEPYIFEVEQISKYVGSELWIRYRNDSIKTKTAEGIPLTEEWLQRLPEDLVSEDIPSWIKYLHQLQNWYWIKKECKTELTLTK